jgi:hypothetical protein
MRAPTLAALALVCVAGGGLGAQSALAQLGLTEAAARTFLFEELKSPAPGRQSDIATAGTRAFLKLPPSARAAAATALFAWAKSYVNSPAFGASYSKYRRDAIPETREYDLTIEQAVKQQIDRQLADLQESRKHVALLPPQERAAILEQISANEKTLRDPAFIKQLQTQLAEERAQTNGLDAAAAAQTRERLPADPNELFARRLREFLDATTNVDFSTKTVSLTGGPDGIEFVDPAVRTKHWMWHEAVIVGPDATAAARAAAQAWLKEIGR